MLYPLFFEPDYKERVWGGTMLQDKLNKSIPFKNTGESWEVACHDNGNSTIRNGSLQGKTLKEVVGTSSKELLGYEIDDNDKFPLLIKFIDAKDKLSVQVHPEDEYAKLNENGELGKSEAWYILDAEPGAKLIAGLKDNVTKDDFVKALEDGHLEQVLNEVEVEAGDVINIPAGFVHAIEDGILLAEIQQNSDTTYRVYDWNRVGLDGNMRELHVDKSLDVIDFEGKHSKDIVPGLSIKDGDNDIIYYVANKYFSIEKLGLKGTKKEDTHNKFIIYMCTSGCGEVIHNNTRYSFNLGDSFMIPASLGEFILEGDASLIKTYIPDIQKDIINELESAGYTKEDIMSRVRISQ
ncbi:mannose-6-phosphate isomerase [Vallitalea longa]|uniref:mannose-6-phosphate isomerase n=1 Tax=Vallitalea longa TaxID=2936439 RepID=A0A9W5Y9H2_9FIRM|nr:mannose-6-phosphate isomerase, class I [Vallitalea longa]GKX28566.1 mannose-6-phosphate isomerase [Vallitalea longa]